MRPATLLLLTASLALAGCTGGDEDGFTPTNVATYVPVSGLTPADATPPTPSTPAPTSPSGAPQPLTLRQLHAAQHARFSEPGRVAISDAGTWRSTWSMITGDGSEPPAVDFERETAVIALHGAAPDGCYHIRVTQAELTGGEVRAVVTTYGPAPGQACTEAVTQPWHAVAVTMPEARVVFEEREGTGPPPPSASG